jgi:methionyl aminopeptidase
VNPLGDVVDPQGIEDVGEAFSISKMLEVRLRTRRAVNAIAAGIEVGMTQRDANEVARATLSEMGLRQGWHPVVVRLGENTAREFDDRGGADLVLQADDIFFVDIGPVYEGIEGDGGDTFVRGENPEHHQTKLDVKAIWDEVREAWVSQGLTGRELYDLATEAGARRGWRLNPALSGHRLSDFPHKAHYRGLMSDVDLVPAPDLWVLEIALVHPTRPIGAFYEDTLLDDQSFAEALT